MSNLSSAKKAISTRIPPQLTLTIKITGKTAEELLAVGPVDIRDHFLAAGFGGSYNPTDVQSIKFTAPKMNIYSKKVNKSVHKENF